MQKPKKYNTVNITFSFLDATMAPCAPIRRGKKRSPLIVRAAARVRCPHPLDTPWTTNLTFNLTIEESWGFGLRAVIDHDIEN